MFRCGGFEAVGSMIKPLLDLRCTMHATGKGLRAHPKEVQSTRRTQRKKAWIEKPDTVHNEGKDRILMFLWLLFVIRCKTGCLKPGTHPLYQTCQHNGNLYRWEVFFATMMLLSFFCSCLTDEIRAMVQTGKGIWRFIFDTLENLLSQLASRFSPDMFQALDKLRLHQCSFQHLQMGWPRIVCWWYTLHLWASPTVISTALWVGDSDCNRLCDERIQFPDVKPTESCTKPNELKTLSWTGFSQAEVSKPTGDTDTPCGVTFWSKKMDEQAISTAESTKCFLLSWIWTSFHFGGKRQLQFSSQVALLRRYLPIVHSKINMSRWRGIKLGDHYTQAAISSGLLSLFLLGELLEQDSEYMYRRLDI